MIAHLQSSWNDPQSFVLHQRWRSLITSTVNSSALPNRQIQTGGLPHSRRASSFRVGLGEQLPFVLYISLIHGVEFSDRLAAMPTYHLESARRTKAILYPLRR